MCCRQRLHAIKISRGDFLIAAPELSKIFNSEIFSNFSKEGHSFRFPEGGMSPNVPEGGNVP